MCVPCGGLYSKMRQLHGQLDIRFVIWKSWITFKASSSLPKKKHVTAAALVFTLWLRKYEWLKPAKQKLPLCVTSASYNAIHPKNLLYHYKQRMFCMCWKWLVFWLWSFSSLLWLNLTTTVALLCRWWFDSTWLNTFHSSAATGDSSGRTGEACVVDNTDRGTLLSEELDTARWLVCCVWRARLRPTLSLPHQSPVWPSCEWRDQQATDRKTLSLISSSCLLYSRDWILLVYLTSWWTFQLHCLWHLSFIAISKCVAMIPWKISVSIPFFPKNLNNIESTKVLGAKKQPQ